MEAAAKAQVAQQQTVPVSEAQVRERIHLSHVNGIDDYSKLFINLAARVDDAESDCASAPCRLRTFAGISTHIECVLLL